MTGDPAGQTRVHPVDLPELTLSVTSAGEGPAIVLLHGFPEVGYSWRHQIPVLAEAGFRVLAPDGRGYGWSDAPETVEEYSIIDLVGDVIALLDADGIDNAVIVGHDWGALVAPWVALMRPDRVRGVALLSVPFVPRQDETMLTTIRSNDPDGDFAYMLAFQEPEVEELFDANPMETLRRIHWTLCGARPADLGTGGELPKGLPPYLSAGEFENYYRAFAKSGFGPPINWYRNIERNFELTRPWKNATLDVPTVFVAGEHDFVATSADGALGPTVAEMAQWCTDLRGSHVIAGAGHWVQQEAPDEVNRVLLDFVQSLQA